MFAAVDRAGARAWTRHGTDISAPLAAVLAELGDLVPAGSVLGGVGHRPRRPDRAGLLPARARRLRRPPYPLVMVVFDAPRWAGEWLTSRPWHERRARFEAP